MELKVGDYKLDAAISAVVVLVVLIGVGWLGFWMGQTSEQVEIASQQATAPDSPTVEEVPNGTAVPEPGDEVDENVATPSMVRATASPTAKNRDFTVEIEGDAFIPQEVIIYQGDASWITFKALDADYDVYQPDKGLSINVAQGESELMAAQFSNPGKYTIYCRSCGGPEEGPIGYITVVPQSETTE